MVVVISFEMLGEFVDSCGQNRNLHLRRAGIALMCLIGCDDSLFGFFLHDFHLINFFAVRFPSERRVKMLIGRAFIRRPRERIHTMFILS